MIISVLASRWTLIVAIYWLSIGFISLCLLHCRLLSFSLVCCNTISHCNAICQIWNVEWQESNTVRIWKTSCVIPHGYLLFLQLCIFMNRGRKLHSCFMKVWLVAVEVSVSMKRIVIHFIKDVFQLSCVCSWKEANWTALLSGSFGA